MTHRWVLVTGASTGIGRACVLRLVREGFWVIATVRQPSGADQLKAQAPNQIIPLLLDVTDTQTIENAVRTVRHQIGDKLHGLVNNAGIATGGPLECLSIQTARQVFDVNIVGLMAVTQAFLPLLKQAHGRIVNIGSASGMIAMPLMSAYAASKFAVRAISDSLRLELAPLGISVCLVAPGKIYSDIWEKAKAHSRAFQDATDPSLLAPYQPYLTYFDRVLETLEALPAESVATAVLKALTATNPRTTYLVGKDALRARILSMLPPSLRDWILFKTFGVANRNTRPI